MKRTTILSVSVVIAIYANAFEVEVISETPQRLVLEFSLGDYEVTEKGEYSYIETGGLGYGGDPGSPALPEITYYLAVPQDGNITTHIKPAQTASYSLSRPLLPIPRPVRGEKVSEYTWELDQHFYGKKASHSFITTDEKQLFRYNYVVPVTISPVNYNHILSQIEVAESITVSVSISGNTAVRNPVRESLDLSGNILNYNMARYWQTKQQADNEYAPFHKSDFWYRFEIPRKGMYKLTSQDLAELPLEDIDPQHIRIFTNGGAVLADAVEDGGNPFRELPIYVAGEGNGRFEKDDYIIFYGENRDGFAKNENLAGIDRYYYNPYCGNGVYWLTFGGNFPSPPLRMANADYDSIEKSRFKIQGWQIH